MYPFKKINRNVSNNATTTEDFEINSKIIDYTIEQQPILTHGTNIETYEHKNRKPDIDIKNLNKSPIQISTINGNIFF